MTQVVKTGGYDTEISIEPSEVVICPERLKVTYEVKVKYAGNAVLRTFREFIHIDNDVKNMSETYEKALANLLKANVSIAQKVFPRARKDIDETAWADFLTPITVRDQVRQK